MVKTIHVLISILLILVGCVPPTRPVGRETPTYQSPGDLQVVTDNIDVYFSDPKNRIDGEYRNGPEMNLVQAIDAARISVDVAVYSINLWSIRDALLDAYHRGLQVRIVMESDNITDEVPSQLQAEGISILGDRRESLMHNKFVILDRQDVWTGSMNLTVGSSYFDNNNLVHLRSSEIAEIYLSEFDEMFVHDMFGKDVIISTLDPKILIGDTQVEVFFSPDDGVARHIVELINSSRESLYFMAYSFTSDEIGSAIIQRSKSGVNVQGVMDDGQIKSNTGTEYDSFKQAGILVTEDRNSSLMHHKVIVIDRSIVITGSYNFSRNAEINNDENIIVIHDLGIATLFIQEFEKIISNIPQ